jgi:hypothetical protein
MLAISALSRSPACKISGVSSKLKGLGQPNHRCTAFKKTSEKAGTKVRDLQGSLSLSAPENASPEFPQTGYTESYLTSKTHHQSTLRLRD